MVNRIFKPRLSKEHYLQVCRFLKTPKDEIDYEQYKKQDCYTQFRIWHKKLIFEKDQNLKT